MECKRTQEERNRIIKILTAEDGNEPRKDEPPFEISITPREEWYEYSVEWPTACYATGGYATSLNEALFEVAALIIENQDNPMIY